MIVREGLTCAVEEAEAVERFTRSYIPDEYPSPFSEMLELRRIERDCCHCGLPEPGWFTVERLLHGCNTGTVIHNVYWDGCCGGISSSHNGPRPLIRGADRS